LRPFGAGWKSGWRHSAKTQGRSGASYWRPWMWPQSWYSRLFSHRVNFNLQRIFLIPVEIRVAAGV